MQREFCRETRFVVPHKMPVQICNRLSETLKKAICRQKCLLVFRPFVSAENFCYLNSSDGQRPNFTEINSEVHARATESRLTLVKVGGVRCPVSLLFLLSASVHTTASLSHRTQAPMMPLCFFFTSCHPPSITAPSPEVLLESWLHLGPSRLAATSVIGSAADCSPVCPAFCSLPTY